MARLVARNRGLSWPIQTHMRPRESKALRDSHCTEWCTRSYRQVETDYAHHADIHCETLPHCWLSVQPAQSDVPSMAGAHVCDKDQHEETGSTSEQECSTRTKTKP